LYLYSISKGNASPYKTIGELYDYMEEILRFKPNEESYIIGINNRGEACKERKLGSGSFSEVKIEMKEIALYVTTYNVSRIIIVHNHPNGNAYPSQADKESSMKLRQICQGVGCELVDSLIVGRDGIYSIFNNEIKRHFVKSLQESVLENSQMSSIKKKSV
jgi:DNA repair protein RadC